MENKKGRDGRKGGGREEEEGKATEESPSNKTTGGGGASIHLRDEIGGLITFTQDAADAFFKSALSQGKSKDVLLRLGVIGGGCAGFNYDMDFADKVTSRDRVIICKGVNLVIDDASLMFLAGTEVGYQITLQGSGFTFSNPNAKTTCGCAKSFTV